MPGKVVKLLVSEGATVAQGQPLLVIEAMKMEHTLTAHTAGAVQGISGLYVGSQVEDGQELLVIVAKDAGRAADEAADATVPAAAGAAAS
jgi:3-methylcrotonyl-CoA carboxylase alpha subunit